VGHRHDEPLEGPPRRGASLSRRTFATFSVVLAALWVAGAALLLRETSSRHATLLDAELQHLEERLHQTTAVLRREAALLAQEPDVVEGARLRDWATLARGAPRLRMPALERVADVVIVVAAGGAVIAQAPEMPPANPPLLTGVSTPTVRFAQLDSEPYLLGVAPVGGDPAAGLVVVGRHAARLAATDGVTLAVFVATGDHLAQATLVGAPAEGWSAAASAGGRTIDGVPWRLRPVIGTGTDVVLLGASEAGARAARRRLALLLGAGLPVPVALVAAMAWVVGPRPRRAPARGRRNLELETLYSAAVAMGSGSDLETTGARTLALICAVARIDVALLYRAEPAGERLALVASHGVPPGMIGLVESRPLRGTRIGEVARSRRHQVMDLDGDAIKDPALRRAAVAGGYTTQLALPVLVDEAPWGVLVLVTRDRRRFDGDELVLLQAVAHQVGLGIARAALSGESRTKARRLETLTRVAQQLTATREPDEVPQRVVDAAREMFDRASAHLWLLEDAGVTLVLRASAGTGAEVRRVPVGQGLVGRAAAERAPVAENAFVGVPLSIGERLLGVLAIAADGDRAFSADDVSLLGSLANQAAVALDNARLLTDEQARRRHLAALLDINTKIGALVSTETLLTSIADEAARLLGVDNAGFRLVEGDDLVLAGLAGTAKQTMLRRRIRIGESLSGRVVSTGRTVIVPIAEATDLLPEHAAADRALGYTTYLGVPLRVGSRTIGVLTFRAPRPFTARDQELAEAFAGQAAVAIEHARLYREAARHAERMRGLAEVSRLLAGTLDPDALADRIVDNVCRLFAARSATVFRLDDATGDLVSVATASDRDPVDPIVFPCGIGAAGLAALTRRVVVSSDVVTDPQITLTPDVRQWIEHHSRRAALGAPLIVNDAVVGALSIGDAVGRVFDDEEIQVAQAFADQAALALANARLYAEATRRRTEAEELARLARTLTESLDVSAVGQRTARSVLPLFHAQSSVVRLLQPDGSLEVLAVGGRLSEHLAPGHVQGPGVGALGRAAAEGRAVIVPDVLETPLPQPLRAVLEEAGDAAVLAVPLRAKAMVIGALGICDRRGRVFTDDEAALLQAFADQATLALDNAKLYQEARTYAERLRALEQVNRLVSSSLNVGEVLANLARAIAQFFDAPYVSVWHFDPAAGRLRRALAHGDAALAAELHDELAVGEGAIGWVVKHRRPILWTDTRTDDRYTDAPALVRRGLCWLTAYPIAIGDRILGAFAVHRATAWTVTPETESLMGSLAAQAAVALENARMYSETTDRLAETRALLEVAEILNSTLDSTQLLERVAIKIAQVCAVDRCSIELWQGDRVVPLMSQFADGRPVRDLWRNVTAEGASLRDVPVNARAIETRRPVIVEDASTTAMVPREWVEQLGLKAFMAVPMVWQDQVIGVVTLDYCDRRLGFEPWQIDLATAVATQLALSLENSRLYAEAQERLRETSTLLAVGRVLSQPDASGDVMRRVAGEVARAFGADMAGAYLLDARREKLVPVGGYHVPKDLLGLLTNRPMVLMRFPWLLEAWKNGRAVSSPDVLHDERFDQEWTAGLPPHSVLFVPTMARGEPVGGLFLVWWHTGRTFTPAEVRLVEGVAAQVGLAMENAELARQTQAKLAETETLLSVSRALSSTLDVQGLVRHFLRSVASATGADCVGSWLVHEDGEWLEPLAGYRIPRERLAAFRSFRVSVLKHPFYAEAGRTRRPIYTNDAMHDPRIPSGIRDQGPHRTQLFVPVVVKDRMIAGFAAVWWDEARDFTEGELALMEAIANQAGVTLENARLFEENRRRVQELSVLHDLSRAVTGQLDRAAVVQALRSQLARVLSAENMVVILRDDERGDLEVAVRISGGVEDAAPPRRFPAREAGLVSIVLALNRPVRTDDYAGACEYYGVTPIATSTGLRYWLGAPMIAGDRVVGVIVVRGGDRAFTEADERLLGNIAHLVALAMSSARLYEERTRALGELGAAQDQLVRTEKLRALGEMASGVAHDFNNLLASILGRAQLLLRRVKEPQERQWLQVIERSALDGAQTVKRLQDFTRIRRDQPLLPLDLSDVVRDALEITQSRWQEEPLSRGITIEVRTTLPAVPEMLGDAPELREVFTNLILNAVDAMPEGGALTLRTAVVEGQVVATVSDTGTGIPAAVRDKIFDPFFTTKGPQGTGLGLSMTYGIVSRHGGTISVESAEGQGTTFRLAFPPAVGRTSAATARAAADAGATRSLRCLVVDDEPTVRTVLADILAGAGHEVAEAADGAEAIARVRAEPFDLVLTDLAMPRVSGWQVARAVKQAAPAVPVFLVTGFGVELSPEERRANGVDAVLVKPLQIQDILEAVAAVGRPRPPAGLPEER
jgi:GAF domain-containing protein/CheY-like chemotaxis protein